MTTATIRSWSDFSLALCLTQYSVTLYECVYLQPELLNSQINSSNFNYLTTVDTRNFR